MKNLYLLALSAFLLLQGQVIASTTDSTPQTGTEQVVPNEENMLDEENMPAQGNGNNAPNQGNVLPQNNGDNASNQENVLPQGDEMPYPEDEEEESAD